MANYMESMNQNFHCEQHFVCEMISYCVEMFAIRDPLIEMKILVAS